MVKNTWPLSRTTNGMESLEDPPNESKPPSCPGRNGLTFGVGKFPGLLSDGKLLVGKDPGKKLDPGFGNRVDPA
jgi:hypothetical protein